MRRMEKPIKQRRSATVPSAPGPGAVTPHRSLFRRFAQTVSVLVGTPAAFATAVALVVVWALLGPLFHFSGTWQLFITTGTTVVTFLMVFLVQHTQNRETAAIRLQIDELTRAVRSARNRTIDVDELTDDELRLLREEFHSLASKTVRAPDRGPSLPHRE